MNLFDLVSRIILDTSDFEDGLDDALDRAKRFGGALKTGLGAAAKAGGIALGAISAAAGGALAGLMALEDSTEEYRIAMGKLHTAYEAAGMSADTAQQAYTEFYKILGDTDTATEASQLLAKLTQSEEDVTKWTKLSAGVWGTFGDSLPIESLIEASNETAKVGVVTGSLADALNWAGISEDEFNLQLAACSDEFERNQLILETLMPLYGDASDAFYKNNEAIVQARQNQADLNKATGALGDTVARVKNRIVADFAPALTLAATALSGLILGTEGADQDFSTAIEQMVTTATDRLPEFITFGAKILGSLASGILGALPTLGASALEILTTLSADLSESLPVLIPAGLETLMGFAGAILDNIGVIVDAAVMILEGLAEGLIAALPVLLEKAPEIIEKLSVAIVENAPKLLNAAVEIIKIFAAGIVESLPLIVPASEQIVDALKNGILGLKKAIWDVGVQIVREIIGGLQSLLSWAQEQAGAFFEDVKNSITGVFDNIGETFKTIGRNIINGLGAGVIERVEWVKNQARRVVDAVKGVFTGPQGFDTHSPSKYFATIGEFLMDGLALGMENSKGQVMETAESLIDEMKSRFTAFTNALTLRQDVGDLDYQLWERTEGADASEAEKLERQLAMLNGQQESQRGIVEAAAIAYEKMVEQYGENSAESYAYQKTLLEEKLAYQDLEDKIREVIAAKEQLDRQNTLQRMIASVAGAGAAAMGAALPKLDVNTVSVADSLLGKASAAMVNAITGNGGNTRDVTLNATLVAPDGTKFANYYLPSFIKAADANGTPIAGQQYA